MLADESVAVGVDAVESGQLRVESSVLFEDLGVAAGVQFVHDVQSRGAVGAGDDGFADAVAVAVVGDVHRGAEGVAGDEAVFEIVLIGHALAEAGADERVAVGVVGVGVQPVIGIEGEGLRRQ